MPTDYQERLAAELEHYAEQEEVHDLPAIYHYWSQRWVTPKLEACGFPGVGDLFSSMALRQAQRFPEPRFVSLGSGNCELELELATHLRLQGCEHFVIECLELNPRMIDRARSRARAVGLEKHLKLRVADVDEWVPDGKVAACLAHHSLHHLVHLETLFERVANALGQEGIFLINDMIGRNGHQRWPEALHEVETLWSILPARFKYNHQLGCQHDGFVNWDCAQEGHEGVRAQDILPLLMEAFHFEVFVAFANVIDVFVDRGYGPNFDPESPTDRAWIDTIARVDEHLLDSGRVKPTHLVAALRNPPCPGGAKVYRHWTPEFCLRRPESRYRLAGQPRFPLPPS